MTAASAPGLLFDLDGTLVETDPTHLGAFKDILAPYGVEVDEHVYNTHIIGNPNADIFMTLLPRLTPADHRRLADEKEALFRSRAGGLKPAEGLIDLLDRADASGVGTVVVTNAPRANAVMMLDVLGIADRFRALVIGDEMERPKPHPDPYLRGLSLLGAAAGRSLAFEDSRSGVRAAAAAELPVVGITSSLAGSALREAGATMVARDFTDPALLAMARELTGLR
ncbi:HAD-IA family hydrolase [Alsobacter sp. SYSU M60028]|uniref:HAD-IA family hydrolase n=1 Tax=Alsobacter ponti TaxID=2962936 RepID=A0ABT1LCQ3_9HYPH|nr:HAD-IA family hydrolase [Alsobacter ponti]MCP8938721.1 HAD-IA family hydrolase [Alsobacter ponti]